MAGVREYCFSGRAASSLWSPSRAAGAVARPRSGSTIAAHSLQDHTRKWLHSGILEGDMRLLISSSVLRLAMVLVLSCALLACGDSDSDSGSSTSGSSPAAGAGGTSAAGGTGRIGGSVSVL